jgi:hypothetical protein
MDKVKSEALYFFTILLSAESALSADWIICRNYICARASWDDFPDLGMNQLEGPLTGCYPSLPGYSVALFDHRYVGYLTKARFARTNSWHRVCNMSPREYGTITRSIRLLRGLIESDFYPTRVRSNVGMAFGLFNGLYFEIGLFDCRTVSAIRPRSARHQNFAA